MFKNSTRVLYLLVTLSLLAAPAVARVSWRRK